MTIWLITCDFTYEDLASDYPGVVVTNTAYVGLASSKERAKDMMLRYAHSLTDQEVTIELDSESNLQCSTIDNNDISYPVTSDWLDFTVEASLMVVDELPKES